MPYTKTAWLNNSAPNINATNLNKMETQYEQALADAKTYFDDKIAAMGLQQGEPGRKYRFISGTLRYVNATTWEFLTDAGHQPTGVTGVTYMADRLRVNYSFTAAKVSTFIATPDETLATIAGVRMGSSVGTTFADIYTYTTAGGGTPINPSTMSNAAGNIWVYGVMEIA